MMMRMMTTMGTTMGTTTTTTRTAVSLQSRRRGGMTAARSTRSSVRVRANNNDNKSWYEEQREDDEAASASASTSEREEENQSFAFEPKSKSKRKRDRSKTRRAKVDVDSPAVDALLGKKEKTLSQETEEAYVKFLFLYVNVIFVCGVVLGVSAFGKLPESVDAFVADKLYPFFTPFVGGFLAFSSVYGLIKTRDDPNA